MAPTFAPDGATIVFHKPRPRGDAPGEVPADQVWDLWSVPATGGEPTLMLQNAGFAQFSPDGHTMAFLRLNDDFTGDVLWLVDAAGGEPRPLVQSPGIESPRWSPDGTRIAYGSYSSVYVVDVASGETRLVSRGGDAEWFDDSTLIVTDG